MPSITELDDRLHCIDLGFQGSSGVIAAYLLQSRDEYALIETGPGSTVPALLDALDALTVDPERITALLVTHIHLDHAGAAGTLLRRFPNAHLYAHDIGVPHLLDPSRLLASATRIYGDMMDTLWGETLPVPPGRVTALEDGDIVSVENHDLRAVYTPGHASHHVVFHEPTRALVFTGDVAAVRLPGFDFVRPPTPPPDIDLEVWRTSIEHVRELQPRTLALTHFGPFSDVERHLDDAERRLLEWAQVIEEALASGQDRVTIVDTVRLHGDAELLRETNDADVLHRYELAAPYGMSVDGYLRSFRKRSAG
jgi:glyoxylase-like metal-dependent hydrolase (beta-lactamase superfamily II)